VTRAAVAALGLIVVAGCSAHESLGLSPGGRAVHRISLSLSNAYVLAGDEVVLVDAGSEGDAAALERALGELGLESRPGRALVLTHGHCDHRGGAPALQRHGRTLYLGRGDLALAEEGRDDELQPTSCLARIVKRLIPHTCERFTPAVVVDDEVSLGPGLRLIPLPGHTAGSLVLLVDGVWAFGGDLMLGPNGDEHYFHADRARNRANLQWLVYQGVQRFFVGHGDPVTRAQAVKAFGLEDALRPDAPRPAAVLK
jgi:glyoxylase-like metal-dependent hydrolase (beta-lactamase superfamily II)